MVEEYIVSVIFDNGFPIVYSPIPESVLANPSHFKVGVKDIYTNFAWGRRCWTTFPLQFYCDFTRRGVISHESGLEGYLIDHCGCVYTHRYEIPEYTDFFHDKKAKLLKLGVHSNKGFKRGIALLSFISTPSFISGLDRSLLEPVKTAKMSQIEYIVELTFDHGDCTSSAPIPNAVLAEPTSYKVAVKDVYFNFATTKSAMRPLYLECNIARRMLFDTTQQTRYRKCIDAFLVSRCEKIYTHRPQKLSYTDISLGEHLDRVEITIDTDKSLCRATVLLNFKRLY